MTRKDQIMTYQRTSKAGNTFKTSEIFNTDNGPKVFILRNQKHTPDDWFLLIGLWSPEEAKRKIDSFCSR